LLAAFETPGFVFLDCPSEFMSLIQKTNIRGCFMEVSL